MIKLIGYWKEDGDRFLNMPSLHESINLSNYSDKEQILHYLTQCPSLVASPGVKKSLLDDEMVGLGIQTNGAWAWPRSLVYYFEKYNILISEEFVDLIRSQAYVAPRFDEERLIAISMELREAMFKR